MPVDMRSWLALIVAPVLALVDQSISYAAVDWACAHQNVLVVHAAHAGFFVLTVAAAVAAWQLWREPGMAPAGEAPARRRFVAGIAAAMAALSALTVAAMWVATWMLAPCVA